LAARSELDVITPRTLDEALDFLRREEKGTKIIAGGSDLIVQLRDGIIQPSKLLNILALKDLRFIKNSTGTIRIGALTTYTDIVHDEITRKHGWVLAQAAKQIGAVQLQNTATIGGNLGNASPAGDSLPPLYALDATVVIQNKFSKREIPIEQPYDQTN